MLKPTNNNLTKIRNLMSRINITVNNVFETFCGPDDTVKWKELSFSKYKCHMSRRKLIETIRILELTEID